MRGDDYILVIPLNFPFLQFKMDMCQLFEQQLSSLNNIPASDGNLAKTKTDG